MLDLIARLGKLGLIYSLGKLGLIIIKVGFVN